MKKDKIKNIFISIFVVMFIISALLLIIKSIDYSKKISKKSNTNNVMDKIEITKNNNKKEDEKKSNPEVSVTKKDTTKINNENINSADVQSEKPKQLKKSDYSFIEDIKDPELTMACSNNEKLVDNKCYSTKETEPVTEYFCDEGTNVSNKCEVEEYVFSDVILLCDGSSINWGEERIDKYCEENNKEQNKAECENGFIKGTLYGEDFCYKTEKKYVDAKLKTICPSGYTLKDGKCIMNIVTNQKMSFCPYEYNYVVLENENKCVKYKK